MMRWRVARVPPQDGNGVEFRIQPRNLLECVA
jgi:hypothetical protein